MKWINSFFIVLILLLQYRLWVGEGSISQLFAIREKITLQSEKNGQAIARNKKISAEVLGLQQGDKAVEAYARSELGLIKANETFFILLDPEQVTNSE